jgi:hypothetical protein
MADQGGLQLLPEARRRVEIKGQKKRGSVILGIILIVLVVAAYIAADFYLTSVNDELAGLDEKVLGINKRRDKEVEKEVRTLNSQLSLISNLLDNHIFWTKGFDRLESLTVPQLKYISLKANVDQGEISARVSAASFSELAKQISSYFADENFESVDTGDISLRPDGQVEASLLIKFNPDGFIL